MTDKEVTLAHETAKMELAIKALLQEFSDKTGQDAYVINPESHYTDDSKVVVDRVFVYTMDPATGRRNRRLP